jgi:putative glutathione S-transferase
MLWDKKHETVVNNESSEIIRIFNTTFNHLLPADKAAVDIYPEAHRAEIDKLNEWVYDNVNSASLFPSQTRRTDRCSVPDGVYKAGFAKTQEAYEKAVVAIFEGLDKLEVLLSGKDYLFGNTLTEADIRLWVTIVSLNQLLASCRSWTA